jgi:hypothetical protein
MIDPDGQLTEPPSPDLTTPMKRLRSLWRTTACATFAATTWAGLSGAAWAAEAAKSDSGGGGGGSGVWVLPYFVVGLGIVLGILAVVLPGKRRDWVRQDKQ